MKYYRLADVPVGGAVVVGDFLVSQPSAGTFLAFSNRCTHAGARITTINADGTATCDAHGAVFDLSTGEHLQGPGQDPLTPVVTANDGTTLTVNP